MINIIVTKADKDLLESMQEVIAHIFGLESSTTIMFCEMCEDENATLEGIDSLFSLICMARALKESNQKLYF